MILERIVPKHKRVEEFNWCKKDFMIMTPRYREIRSKCGSPMDTCYWCKHKMVDGEMMALANPKMGKNRILCQNCANELMSSNVVSPNDLASDNPPIEAKSEKEQ